MGGILKRSREEMESGSKTMLQNPGDQAADGPRKKAMLNAPNGTSTTKQGTDIPQAGTSSTNGMQTETAQQETTDVDRDSVMPDFDPAHLLATIINEDPPPINELESSWIPFRRVVGRVAQEAFNELVDTLENLHTEASKPPAKQPRDYTEAEKKEMRDAAEREEKGDYDKPFKEPSREMWEPDFLRRKRLWDFAKDQRQKLIKILIMSQWVRNQKSVSKLIDISAYLREKKDFWDQAINDIFFLNQRHEDWRMPAPDTMLSLKILHDQKADWIDDLGYLPKKPITSRAMLDSMHDLNAILAARLQLHDSVPEAFKNFSIRDGRVTFHAKDEFDLSLTAGSDKHDEQLYFVDMVFTFSPGEGRVPEGHARNWLASTVDRTLMEKSLQDVYDALHNFTLTHKLSILAVQARDLTLSRWSDNVKISPVHRELILEYWAHRSGPKNWIEIGIVKKRPKDDLLQGDVLDTPYLALKWYRHGKLVQDHGLDLDVANLSVETILKDVLAAHTNWILDSIKRGLRETAHDRKSTFKAKHRNSRVEPAQCALDITFPDGQEVTLNQEPITGWLTLLPSSEAHRKCEHEINMLHEPSIEAVRLLKQVRATVAQERHKSTVSLEGWKIPEMPKLNQDILVTYFGKDVFKYEFYRPTTQWPESLCLCLSHHLSGQDIWHLAKLRPRDKWVEQTAATSFLPADTNPLSQTIKIGKVPSRFGLWQTSPNGSTRDHEFLRWIVAEGAGLATRHADYTWLRNVQGASKDQVYLEPIVENQAINTQKCIKEGATLGHDPITAPKLWIDLQVNNDAATNTCYDSQACSAVEGVRHQDGLIMSATCARLSKPLPINKKVLYFDNGSIRIIPKSNLVCFCLRTPVGTPSIPVLFERMAGFARIATCVSELRRMGLMVETFDLEQMTANLAPWIHGRVKERRGDWSNEQFRMYFTCNDKGPSSVRFHDQGPFRNMEPHFNDLLHGPRGSFTTLAKALRTVLPVLLVLAEQRKHNSVTSPSYSVTDLAHMSAIWGIRSHFIIGYSMTLDKADGMSCWRLNKWSSPRIEIPDHAKKIEASWSELCRTKGDGWTGLVQAMQVDMSDPSSALWNIYDTFAPHVKAWFDDCSRPTAAATGEAGVRTANATQIANGKSQAGDKENHAVGEKRKGNKTKDNHQVITLD